MKNGVKDLTLLKLAIAIRARCEFAPPNTELSAYNFYFALLVERFSSRMWTSLHSFEPDEVDTFLQDETQLAIWAEVFKLHYISQR